MVEFRPSLMATKTFIPCLVSPGFFSSEAYVVLNAGASFVVDRRDVRGSSFPEQGEIRGKVAAYVIENKGEQSLVELPGEPVSGGQPTWVPTSELEMVNAA